jgi:hypothetical protein
MRAVTGDIKKSIQERVVKSRAALDNAAEAVRKAKEKEEHYWNQFYKTQDWAQDEWRMEMANVLERIEDVLRECMKRYGCRMVEKHGGKFKLTYSLIPQIGEIVNVALKFIPIELPGEDKLSVYHGGMQIASQVGWSRDFAEVVREALQKAAAESGWQSR